jgi:hypothetical protein
MTADRSLQTRFKVGAGLELAGIVLIAAALGAGLGGALAIVVGGAALAVGAAVQVWAILKARRS